MQWKATDALELDHRWVASHPTPGTTSTESIVCQQTRDRHLVLDNFEALNMLFDFYLNILRHLSSLFGKYFHFSR
jgi:hypothetical protein